MNADRVALVSGSLPFREPAVLVEQPEFLEILSQHAAIQVGDATIFLDILLFIVARALAASEEQNPTEQQNDYGGLQHYRNLLQKNHLHQLAPQPGRPHHTKRLIIVPAPPSVNATCVLGRREKPTMCSLP